MVPVQVSTNRVIVPTTQNSNEEVITSSVSNTCSILNGASCVDCKGRLVVISLVEVDSAGKVFEAVIG
jgi:hypothetical protein